MKKQLNQLRRFFARTGARKLNAATAREVIPASYDDDDSSNRLSGAFIVVLVLHVIALVGVFAFSRMKEPKPSGNGSGAPSQPAFAAANSTSPDASSSAPANALATSAPTLQPESGQSSQAPAATETAASSVREPEPPMARSNSRTHVVKSGENLTKIAIAWGVRPTELITANGLKSDEIRPGQELVIPDAKAARSITEPKPVVKSSDKTPTIKTTPNSYTVRKNDTLVKIARQLGVRYDDLTKLNNIKDPRKLQEGQILKVPKKS